MGDAGEGLIDANDKFEQRKAELEQDKEKQRKANLGPPRDAGKERQIRSLTLARTNLESQAKSTENPARKEQIRQAIEELDRRLAEL